MKMGHKSDIKLIVDGKRADGREFGQLREVEMKVDVVNRANGSAMVRFGNTVAVAAAYGPRELFPKFMQEPQTGILRVRYNMAPFSVDDRKSPGHDRRSTEISKVVRLALGPGIFLEDFPKVTIDVFIEIIQADGSTRVTGINAASLALADAGVPMRDLVSACSVGKIDGGKLVADLNGIEDNFGETDMAIAMQPGKNKLTLMQMDGVVTRQELDHLFKLATENCKKIYEMQKKVLKETYRRV
jgi:exosome complex component RRP41